MAQASAVAVDELLYHIIIVHLHDGGHAVQTVYIVLLGVDGVDIFHVTVVCLVEVGLGHIEVKQTVQVIGHGFGEFDNLFTTLVVDNGDLVFVGCLVVVILIDLCPRGSHSQ